MQKNALFFKLFLIFIIFFSISSTSCLTLFNFKKQGGQPSPTFHISRKLLDAPRLTPTELADFFMTQNQDIEYQRIFVIAHYYFFEAQKENINSTVAFAQMCLETGFLRFGNLVTPEMNNFCGLGSTDAEHPGVSFPTARLGIRAHIQHLQAYATTEDVLLHEELVDPRYDWVHKTKYVETIQGLAGTWATDKNYADKIDRILQQMEEFIIKRNRLAKMQACLKYLKTNNSR